MAKLNELIEPHDINYIINYYANPVDEYGNPREGSIKVKYDERTNHFVYYDLFGLWEREISDIDILEILKRRDTTIYQQGLITELISTLWIKYGDAVFYFYNNASVDENGIFLSSLGGFRKQYFTNSELDDLNKRYKDKIKS